jgi:hypothetical protein
MDTNEQVETQITYLGQPTHENGKPMNTDAHIFEAACDLLEAGSPEYVGAFRLHDMEDGVVCALDARGGGGEICNTHNGFGNQRIYACAINSALISVMRLSGLANCKAYKDGSHWCVVGDDFVDLQRSSAGFGEDVTVAAKNYLNAVAKKTKSETHMDAKPMHTPLPLSSEVYQYGMSVMTKDHYTMCTARSKDEAMKIVQALNRAPAFDAILSALETLYIKDSHSDLSTKDLQYEAAAGSERAAATLKARLALKIAKGEA